MNARVTHVLRNPEGHVYRDVLRVPFDAELRTGRLPFPPLVIASLPRLS